VIVRVVTIAHSRRVRCQEPRDLPKGLPGMSLALTVLPFRTFPRASGGFEGHESAAPGRL
jgi:hypothetical protein